MIRAAIIRAGLVENIVEEVELKPGQVDITGLRVGPGDAYDEATGTFTPAAPPASLVPAEVTMRQASDALLLSGKFGRTDAQVDATILSRFDALPEPQRSLARNAWLKSNTVQRDNPFVRALGPALGMTEAEIDALFVAAARL